MDHIALLSHLSLAVVVLKKNFAYQYSHEHFLPHIVVII